MAYANVSDIQARLRGRTIDSNSKPSTDDVTQWLKEADAYLNGALKGIGVNTPVEDDDGKEVLKSLACDYAEAHVRMSWDTNNAGEGDDGIAMLDRFMDTLKEIQKDPSFWEDMLAGGGDSSVRVSAYALNNDVGEPDFDRDFET